MCSWIMAGNLLVFITSAMSSLKLLVLAGRHLFKAVLVGLFHVNWIFSSGLMTLIVPFGTTCSFLKDDSKLVNKLV